MTRRLIIGIFIGPRGSVSNQPIRMIMMIEALMSSTLISSSMLFSFFRQLAHLFTARRSGWQYLHVMSVKRPTAGSVDCSSGNRRAPSVPGQKPNYLSTILRSLPLIHELFNIRRHTGRPLGETGNVSPCAPSLLLFVWAGFTLISPLKAKNIVIS